MEIIEDYDPSRRDAHRLAQIEETLKRIVELLAEISARLERLEMYRVHPWYPLWGVKIPKS